MTTLSKNKAVLGLSGGVDSTTAALLLKEQGLDVIGFYFDVLGGSREGAEAAALEGMREVLKEHKPKLMVSAYHRIEDFFALPLQILEVRPDYQVYLRKSPYYPAWEVNLYCR